ncbi:MAG TPA: short chain dehydrogenase [Kofleriaceae bacterium]|jgi:NAD(P)-dependent dehydrogenase (short-subunit alcohol dehydrogenase family)
MKVIVIGSTGTIGSAVVKALEANGHQVTGVHRKSDPPFDIQKPELLAAVFAKTGKVDAVVSCAGGGAFGKSLEELTDQDLAFSLSDKLMGQVNVIRNSLKHLNDGGSITVTSGTLARDPMPKTSAISMINAGIEGFAIGAALDAPRGIRINAVAPPWIKETLEAYKMDSAHGQPAADCAKVYLGVVEGKDTGKVVPTKS